jgi:hypothetical protein
MFAVAISRFSDGCPRRLMAVDSFASSDHGLSGCVLHGSAKPCSIDRDNDLFYTSLEKEVFHIKKRYIDNASLNISTFPWHEDAYHAQAFFSLRVQRVYYATCAINYAQQNDFMRFADAAYYTPARIGVGS